MRPTTGPTALTDDVLGTFVPSGRRRMLDEAHATGRLVREGDPEWRDDVPVRVEVIPVRRAGRVIALVARNTNLLGVRTPEPPRAVLPADRRRADPDDRRRLVPAGGPAQRPRRLAAGRRRVHPPRRRRPGRLRQPQRAVGLPPPRAHRRPHPPRAGRPDPRAGAAAASPRRGDPQRRARRPGRPRHRGRHRRGQPRSCAASRCARRGSGSARWCCCATSPTCAAATASWSPRTPPSARSTTG